MYKTSRIESKLERYGTVAPIEDRKEEDTGMKTSTPSPQKNRTDDLIVFLAGHPCFGGYLSHRRRPSTMQNKTNQSESEKIRPDAANVQRTTGAKTKPLSLLSVIADDACP